MTRARASVHVRVVSIRHMRVAVPGRRVPVDVAMRSFRHGIVHMVMVSVVVAMRVLMLDEFMGMLMLV